LLFFWRSRPPTILRLITYSSSDPVPCVEYGHLESLGEQNIRTAETRYAGAHEQHALASQQILRPSVTWFYRSIARKTQRILAGAAIYEHQTRGAHITGLTLKSAYQAGYYLISLCPNRAPRLKDEMIPNTDGEDSLSGRTRCRHGSAQSAGRRIHCGPSKQALWHDRQGSSWSGSLLSARLSP
jgi:hypothetical protein